MSNSKEYSSLFALVDSHLSKTSVDSVQTSKTPFKIPSLRNGPNSCNSSESQITSPLAPCLPISPFNISASPIKSVLAEQVANMLKAKEKKQEEEQKRMMKGMQKLNIEDDDYVIDLMKVLQTPYIPVKQTNEEEVLSSSSSLESLFELKLKDFNQEPDQTATSNLSMPCITDISYILNQKVCKAKPSTFGKVLTSRLRPVAAPYLQKKIESEVKPFDFSTPSPCDIHKEKQRKPTMSCSFTAIIEID